MKYSLSTGEIPRGCAPRESLITLGNSLEQIFPDNPYRLSTVCTTLQCTQYQRQSQNRTKTQFIVNVYSIQTEAVFGVYLIPLATTDIQGQPNSPGTLRFTRDIQSHQRQPGTLALFRKSHFLQI